MPRTLSTTAKILATGFAIFVSTSPLWLPDQVGASRSDLSSFLEHSEKMATHTHAVRADFTITAADGSTEKAAAIIDPKRKRLFYAANEGAWRALAPLAWDTAGKVSVTKGAEPTTFGPNDRLGDTDLRPLAFFPFWSVIDYNTAFISDNTRLEKTVTLYPGSTSPYKLFVVTFDKEKLVPTATKFFEGEMNHLTRVQFESDHTMVGARPRPRKIVVNNYDDNSKVSYAIEWTLLESIPDELLDESTFHTASFE